MRERTIEKHLCDRVHRAGGMCVKFIPTAFAGFPDRIVLLPKAKITFVELKAPGKKPTKLQCFVHERLRAMGFRVLVLDSIASVDEWFA